MLVAYTDVASFPMFEFGHVWQLGTSNAKFDWSLTFEHVPGNNNILLRQLAVENRLHLLGILFHCFIVVNNLEH